MTDGHGNEALIDSWQLSLHDKASSSRDQYRQCVEMFTAWLGDDLLETTRRDCERWFMEQGEKGLSQSTRRSRWIAMRSFFGWAHDEDEIDTNPMAKVKVAKSQDEAPDVLSIDELKSLLKACAGRDIYARRDTAILRLFISTGVRLNECASLKVDDVDLGNRLAFIHGKGGKARTVRFDAPTAAALDRYLRVRGRHRLADRSELWVGLKGPLQRRGMQAALDRRAAAAGLVGFHAHRLRHSFAHIMKSQGASDEDLLLLGGWNDARTMQRYGQRQAVDRALNAYDRLDAFGDL